MSSREFEHRSLDVFVTLVEDTRIMENEVEVHASMMHAEGKCFVPNMQVTL